MTQKKNNWHLKQKSLDAECARFARETGIHYYSYLVHEGLSLINATEEISFHNLPIEWISLYESRDANRFDPVLNTARESRRSYVWVLDELREDQRQWTPDQRSLMRAAAEYGLTGGCVIPLYGPSSAFATFSLLTRCAPSLVRDHLKSNLSAWQSRAEKIHDWAMDTALRHDLKSRLTNQQRRVLELFARGCRTARVAEHLNLTEKAVEYHANKAKEVLVANTLPQAVAIALSGRQITLKPWAGNDRETRPSGS